MPTIKFKLKDQKYCNGCYVLRLHYKKIIGGIKAGVYAYCEVLKIIIKQKLNIDKTVKGTFYSITIKRPKSCIDKYGE